ncbi:MAG: hypothetical protein ACFCGT_03985 [Sandaracinaceae bacterium]
MGKVISLADYRARREGRRTTLPVEPGEGRDEPPSASTPPPEAPADASPGADEVVDLPRLVNRDGRRGPDAP